MSVRGSISMVSGFRSRVVRWMVACSGWRGAGGVGVAGSGPPRRSVEQHLVALTPEVLRLLDGSVVGLEVEVEADPVAVVVADQAQVAERLEHLDPVRPHLLPHLVVGSHARGADAPLQVAAPNRGVR